MNKRLTVLSFCLLAVAAFAEPETVRIASFKAVISPEVGAKICGYDADQTSVTKHDDLWALGLAIDDGKSKSLIVTFDLLGLDGETIRPLRRKCAEMLGIPESAVFFSCTHNHSGPESVRRFNMPQYINREYLDFLERQLLKGVSTLVETNAVARDARPYQAQRIPDGRVAHPARPQGDDTSAADGRVAHPARPQGNDTSAADGRVARPARPSQQAKRTTCRVLFNSAFPDLNYNRRYVTSDNCASFVPLRREYQPLCKGHTDQELGLLLFYEVGRVAGGDGPVFVIGNYAAHVLSSHSAGLGGIRISADFPGYFRDYIKSETGADALFVQGSCGDICPYGDEEGMGAAKEMGEKLARAAINAMCDADRNPKRFTLEKPVLASAIRTVKLPMRSDLRGRIQPEFDGSDDMNLEVQCWSVGDVAFAGMPGELLAEPGLEVKWNSPFRRTWIANLSTGFAGYMSPPNFMVAGGYEPLKQSFRSRGTFKLVSETIDQLFELRAQAFPEDCKAADPYPDNLTQPIVNIPEAVKYRKVKAVKREVGK